MGRAEYERHATQPEHDDPAGGSAGGASEQGEQSVEPSAGADDRPEQAGDEAAEGEPADGGDRDESEAEEAETLDPLELAERQRDEYLDLLRRERAEFENFRKRANRERMDALDRGAEGIVNDLLGVLDNFGFVLEAAEASEDTQLAKGVQMVHTELLRALEAAGLEEVPGEGAPFDPTHHEAMMQVEADEPTDEPTVVEVLRPGYRFKGRVLRAASVSVAQ